MILKGAVAKKFQSELWTLSMFRVLIENEFDGEYQDDHFSRFVHRLGLSVQRPMVRARERDVDAVKRFAKLEFPAIEKERGGGVAR